MWPISIYSTPSNKAQCVNHVPEHPLTMSPVYTEGEGGGEGCPFVLSQRPPFVLSVALAKSKEA